MSALALIQSGYEEIVKGLTLPSQLTVIDVRTPIRNNAVKVQVLSPERTDPPTCVVVVQSSSRVDLNEQALDTVQRNADMDLYSRWPRSFNGTNERVSVVAEDVQRSRGPRNGRNGTAVDELSWTCRYKYYPL